MSRGFLVVLALIAALVIVFHFGTVGSIAGSPVDHDKDTGITLPPGFHATIFADKLGPSRFIAVAPNGDVYVKRTDAGITALRDTQGTGHADVVKRFGEGGGTGIAVHDACLYYSTNDMVFRYRMLPGELVPSSEPECIVHGLPEQDEHESKAFAFDSDGLLYVEVGCPSNASGDPDRGYHAQGVDPAELFARHGGFWRFKSDRLRQDQTEGTRYGAGFRHILAVAWQPAARAFFVVQMGRDQLNTVDPQHFTARQNAELPAEEMHKLTEASNFGWPYTYWDAQQKARMLSPEFGGDGMKKAEPGKFEDPLLTFPAHWAPMQMTCYSGTQFPAHYRNGMFVAFHGSWNRAPLAQAGYKVCFVPFNEAGMPSGGYEVFADGFAGSPEIWSPDDARFRACGVAEGPDGSLYIADSEEGRVWKVTYRGDGGASTLAGQPAAVTNSVAVTEESSPGQKIYAENCAACHQVDGSGVVHINPPLRGDAIVASDPALLVQVALKGSDAPLRVGRPHYENRMPPFARLSDEDLAALLSYVRAKFGNGAAAVEVKDVAAARGK